MKMLPTVAVCSAALLSTGCPNMIHEGAAPGARVDNENAPNARLNLDTVVILDKSLQDKDKGRLAIESSGGRRTATGTLEVYAVIRNRTDFAQQIEARTQFFDDVGAPVEGPTAWRRMFLNPQSINAYKELSTRVHDVAHYYVEIREAR